MPRGADGMSALSHMILPADGLATLPPLAPPRTLAAISYYLDLDQLWQKRVAMVSAMALSIFVGSEFEKETLVSLAKLVDEGEKYGVPVLAVTAVGKDMARDVRYLGLSCRIAAELGAHIVKTYYCDKFEELIESCPIPVIVAGGKKTPEMEALELTCNAVKGGAVGVDMGRNIFQSDSPVGMIKAVRAIVHENVSVKEAYRIYESEKSAVARKAS